MAVTVTGVLWMPTAWFLLSILTPKALLEKYFKEPHFTTVETILMAQFPGFLMRTAMFGWALFFPSLTKKRKIKDPENYMPPWYRIALKAFIIGVTITMFLFFSLMGILLLMNPTETPVIN
jgi:Na+-driven multidrug efflux pump